MTAVHPEAWPDREAHIPGETGIWVLIGGDLIIFAALFATFLNYRRQDIAGFAAGRGQLHQAVGLASTLLLLLSSLLVMLAVKAMRATAGSLARWALLGAIACGVSFSALKVLDYQDKVAHGHTPASSTFFMLYFVLTGLHWFHLAIGLVVLGVLLRLACRPVLGPRQIAWVEAGACFWHMVDLLWIILFPLLYLVA